MNNKPFNFSLIFFYFIAYYDIILLIIYIKFNLFAKAKQKTMKKNYLFILITAFLFVLTGCGNKTNNPNVENSQPKIKKASLVLTMSELAKHNTREDCWQLINGQVYDLSSYTMSGEHPGGEKILNGCGFEATAMFKEITKHSGKAEAMLNDFLLGPIQLTQ